MPLDREAPSVTSPCQQLNAFVESFCTQKREETRLGLQSALQAQIDALEKTFTGARQKRSKRFYSPVGTMELVRRAYLENGHSVCKADTLLGLPASGWFVQAEELACVLGVSAEFIHACELLAKTTGIELSDHGLANRVEFLGQLIHEQAQAESVPEVYPLDTALHRKVCRRQLARSIV